MQTRERSGRMSNIQSHRPIVTNNESFAIIRAILLNKSTEMANVTNDYEKTMAPILKKSFNISDQQYNEISEKILEYSAEEITVSELQLRYAWKDNHPIYKSKAFRDPDGHEKWQKKEFQDIKKLLKDPTSLDKFQQIKISEGNGNGNGNGGKNEKLKPSINDIFGCTLKKHTIEKSNGGGENIHIGYKILVNAFISYSSQEIYREERIQPIKQSLLKNDLFNLGLLDQFTWILNGYSKLYGIRDFYRYLVIYEVLTQRFDDNPSQLQLLLNCFNKLLSIKKQSDQNILDKYNEDQDDISLDSTITLEEDNLFNQISSLLFNNLLNRVGNYRLCFTPSSVEKLPQRLSQSYQRMIKSIPLTAALGLMKLIVDEIFPEFNFISVVKKSIVEENEKEFLRSTENFESLYNGQIQSSYSDIFLLSKVINDVIERWFDWEIHYFNLAFTDYLRESSSSSSSSKDINDKTIHLQLVFETTSKFINKSVSLMYQKYSKEKHTVTNSKTGKLEPAPWITCLFADLIPVLIKYNEIVTSTFNGNKKFTIALEGEISFLTGQFILNRIAILNTNINHLIKKQEWKPNGKGVFHTSCPIDLFEFITQCYGTIQNVEMRLAIPAGLSPLTRSFGMNLGDTFLMYVKGIRTMVLSDLPFDLQKQISSIIDQAISNKQSPKQLFQLFIDQIRTLPKLPSYNITDKMCLQINDIEHTRGLLSEFDDKYGNIFRDSLNELYTTLKDHWNCLLTYCVFKLNSYIKPLIVNISLSLNDNSTLIATRELTNFIELNLSFCNKKLQANLFPVLLKRLFQSIVSVMLDIILPSKKNFNKMVVDKALSNFVVLMDDLTKVFHGEGDKTSSYFDLTLDDYNKIKKVIEIYSFDTDQLIDYHKLLLKAHSNSMNSLNTVIENSNSNNLLTELCTIMNFKRSDNKEIDKYISLFEKNNKQ